MGNRYGLTSPRFYGIASILDCPPGDLLERTPWLRSPRTRWLESMKLGDVAASGGIHPSPWGRLFLDGAARA